MRDHQMHLSFMHEIKAVSREGGAVVLRSQKDVNCEHGSALAQQPLNSLIEQAKESVPAAVVGSQQHAHTSRK